MRFWRKRTRRCGLTKSVCRCDRSDDLNLSQTLQVANGSLVHGKLISVDNRLRQLLRETKSLREIMEEYYLAAWSRMPTDPEMSGFEQFVARHKDRSSEDLFEDLLWALINSNEFLFQH